MSWTGCQNNPIYLNSYLQKSLESFGKKSADKMWFDKNSRKKVPCPVLDRVKCAATVSALKKIRVSAIFQCFKPKIISCGPVKLNIRCSLNSSLSHAQKQQYSFRNYFIPLWITIAASPLLSVAGSGTRATERRRSRSRSRANVIESKLAKRHSLYIGTVTF